METTASSIAMEVRASTEALRFMSENRHRKAVIVSDSMSMLQKVKKTFSTLTGSTLSVKVNSNLSHGFFVLGTQVSRAMREQISWLVRQ